MRKFMKKKVLLLCICICACLIVCQRIASKQGVFQEEISFLEKYHDFFEKENAQRAALIHLDDDLIPELLILKNGEYRLYTFEDSQVKAITMPNAEVKAKAYGQQHNFEEAEYQTFYWFEYVPYQGLIRVHGGDDERNDQYLKYSDGSLSVELEVKTTGTIGRTAWHTYDREGGIPNEEFLSQISIQGYDNLIPCGYLYDDIETAYENMDATSDTRQMLEDFVSGKINALDHVEGESDIPENGFVMISYEDYFEYMTAGDEAWIEAINVEYIDFDNDGEDELFIKGYAGSCIYFDVIGNTVYRVLETSSTTDMSHVAEFQGKRVIARTDLGHIEREYYRIMEFDPCCCLIDWFVLSASYEGTTYTEEDEFSYRNREISMYEFEELLDSIQLP